MTNTDLKELLDALHDKYNSPDFIVDDPISVPHRYTDRTAIRTAPTARSRDFSPPPSPGATVRPLFAAATA